MKNLLYPICILGSFCISIFANAQEGIITYEVENNLHRTVSQGQEDIKKVLPEIYITKHKLYFTAEASLYKMDMNEKEELKRNGGKKFILPEYDIYIHSSSRKRIVSTYFNGRKYIIEYPIKTLPWEIGEETKSILGYTCYKATIRYDENKGTMTAWFTKNLRSALGPYTFYTLPGTVLEINVNNGNSIFKATNIEFRKLEKKEIMPPVKGEKLTEEEYLQMIKR